MKLTQPIAHGSRGYVSGFKTKTKPAGLWTAVSILKALMSTA
ncbi:MAG: hypothetical protein ACRD40_02925 [Candidatus Acidiferrales bacterium]